MNKDGNLVQKWPRYTKNNNVTFSRTLEIYINFDLKMTIVNVRWIELQVSLVLIKKRYYHYIVRKLESVFFGGGHPNFIIFKHLICKTLQFKWYSCQFSIYPHMFINIISSFGEKKSSISGLICEISRAN